MADHKLKHRSWVVTEGPERAPHRSMFHAMGLNDDDLARPFIGVAQFVERSDAVQHSLEPACLQRQGWRARGIGYANRVLHDRCQ